MIAAGASQGVPIYPQRVRGKPIETYVDMKKDLGF
jgi:hypothetical protein